MSYIFLPYLYIYNSTSLVLFQQQNEKRVKQKQEEQKLQLTVTLQFQSQTNIEKARSYKDKLKHTSPQIKIPFLLRQRLMFQHTRLRSPSLCASKRTYDYLGDQAVLTSNDKIFSGSKPRLTELSPFSKQQTEYELIVQFQLRRQKEKNMILQERLRNKESFIKQMKQFQDELTLAFQKCQQQLHHYKTQCQEYESKWNSFVTFNNGVVNNSNLDQNNVNTFQMSNEKEQLSPIVANEQIVRQYVEQIAELKHLVIRLQEEVNQYEKREKTLGQNLSASMKKEFLPTNPDSKLKQTELNYNPNSPNKKNKYSKTIMNESKQRSKTLANQFVEQKKQQNFNTHNKISDFIKTQTRKISSFLAHFLTMCEFFDESIQKEHSIKHKLKRAWKWIKTTIAEWNYLKKQKLDKVKEYKIGNIVTKMLPLSNLSISEIQTLLEKIIKPSKQHHPRKLH